MSGRRAALASVAALILAAFPALCQTCPEGNLAEGIEVESRICQGDPGVLNDGWLAVEGNAPGPLDALALGGPAAWAQIDLGEPTPIGALLVQADGNDLYVIEGSSDGTNWRPVWTAPVVQRSGWSTRFEKLYPRTTARFLRVRGSGGDGRYAISELQVWCRAPELWPPPMRFRPRDSDAPWRAGQIATGVKFGLAIAGLLLFLWGLALQRAGRRETDLRLRERILMVLAVMSMIAWWNFGLFHHYGFTNNWEMYHYYLGAKYYAELEHSRLYACTTIADFEDGLRQQVLTRRVRDLSTNDIGGTESILGDPSACKKRFTRERWEAFKHDVRWFRGKLLPPRWERIFGDHGYNASPVWSLVGGTLARILPASDGAMLALALVDPMMLLVMWAVVWWAFGWRSTAVALLWFGTNLLSEFGWTGGGLLREDWLLLAIAGICLVKKGWPAAGGAALTWATLLRVFPGFIVFALVLKVLWRMIRERRFTLEPAQGRFAAGCLAALLVLIPLSMLQPGGAHAWRAFMGNTVGSVRSTGTNVVGMMAILSYEPDNRQEVMKNPLLENPYRDWLAAKREVFSERRPAFWILLIGYLALLIRAVRDEEDWAALALGIGLIPMAAFPACYYFTIFLGLGLLRRRLPYAGGALLCGLAVFTHIAQMAWRLPIEMDQRFAWNSLAVVVTVVSLTALIAWRPAETDEVG
jgi:hypothetical protein